MRTQYKSLTRPWEVRHNVGEDEEFEDDDEICEDCKDQTGGVGLANSTPSISLSISFEVFRNVDGSYTLMPTIQIRHY